MKIVSTALTGMKSAQIKFEKSASNLLNASTPEIPPEPETTEIQPITAIPEIGTQSTAYIASDADLIESSVDMISSSFAYKANSLIVKTWDETEKSVLSSLTA